ncbi:PREDICTED: protein ENHANCED DISEASE RESISTANCE 2-like [Nicotiana attenuata]|uniref:Protein enhanced disease resistance 2 n=1 Tax=Nicotiana attenuata TaxID=49451 RepID=A0A1J6IE05_NICAT|nr:PREDICTED: protein ENHANCED DISEASE RESISTANCE 2-like [Nicotiana attenuata]OIS97178.1 protein enhanced disease resistance 2 [Nicotiana attenuata]
MASQIFPKVKSESSESGGSESGADEKGGNNDSFEYFGWVYHLGVNSIGHEYCHLRFLYIRGKYMEMYNRDPHENPGTKPIRRGVISHTLMVEELGRRRVNHGDLYVLRFQNRLDESKRGEIACASPGEVRKWMEAFDQAKQQADYEISRGQSARDKLKLESEINLDGHRPRVRRYAHGLKKLIRIGQGPENLLRQASSLGANGESDVYFEADGGDVIEAHEWKCVRTLDGVRIFEDMANKKTGKGVLVKAIALVEASADTVFDVLLSLDRRRRYEWDTLTGDLELVESLDGHCDVVYGTLDLRKLSWWQSKRDFFFSRRWFHGQDGTYTILHFPTEYKKRPPKSGYRRIKINPSSWEISNISTSSLNPARCLVTLILEIHSKHWFKWKNNEFSKFERTLPFGMLSQVAGLKEYIGANPALTFESSTVVLHSKTSSVSTTSNELEDTVGSDEFYDAIGDESSSSDEDSDDEVTSKKDKKVKLKNVSWAIASLALKRTSAPDISKELNPDVPPLTLDPSQFHGTMRLGKSESDSDCWSSPSGSGFMIRGKTYLKDSTKVTGGDPLLKLIAVDWFKVDECITNVALHSKCLVQSEAGKKLPFVLIINLMVPAKPNYSLVLYYAADRPVKKNSLLGKFIDGTDSFRDSRFKLIPSIIEGYWMVKRAVGTKACLLGKAVTCKYLRQDNFLEIDVDIGSSSVARGVIGLVLGYVTSLVVDLAILIEAKEEAELPEYILGTVRLNRVKVDSAVPLEG